MCQYFFYASIYKFEFAPIKFLLSWIYIITYNYQSNNLVYYSWIWLLSLIYSLISSVVWLSGFICHSFLCLTIQAELYSIFDLYNFMLYNNENITCMQINIFYIVFIIILTIFLFFYLVGYLPSDKRKGVERK